MPDYRQLFTAIEKDLATLKEKVAELEREKKVLTARVTKLELPGG